MANVVVWNHLGPEKLEQGRLQTIASWCTEPNQSAMISPIIRSEVHGTFRGDVSINHCMQSTYYAFNSISKSRQLLCC